MYNILKEIAEFTKADRCIVANIHSLKFDHPFNYEKVFSVMAEYCNPDIFEIKSIIKNKSLSILKNEYSFYNNKGFLFVTPNNNLPNACTAHLKIIDVNILINKLIYFGTGDYKLVTGILSLHYCNKLNGNNFNIEEDVFYDSYSDFLESKCILLNKYL